MPRPDPVGGGRTGVRLQPGGRELAAAARELAAVCAGCAAWRAGSTLEFYRDALALRREHGLGAGELAWSDSGDPDILIFTNGDVTVVANTGAGTSNLPAGRVLLTSGDAGDGLLPADTTVWMLAD